MAGTKTPHGSRGSGGAWTFVVTSLALFMVTLDNLVVTTALPVIKRELGASLQSLEWTVNAYTLTFAVLLLTGAALGDRFGRKRMFAIGIGLCRVGVIFQDFIAIAETIAIAVHLRRRRTVFVDFVAVCQAIAIGVFFGRIGLVLVDFLAVL